MFRYGSARFVVCGAVMCAGLLLARQHVLAALSALVAVAALGALRRAQEQASPRGLGGPPARVTSAQGRLAKTAVDRQTLEAALDAEWAREHRAGDPTALVLLAVDAFEHIEEQGGPLAANVAMLTLASALGRSLPREADLLARYNDSTFAVMLRGTDLPGSLRVAARLRWAIVRLGVANAGTASGFLTACTGMAVQHGAPAGGTPALLAAAERALAAAQTIGHDHLEYVELAGEDRAENAPASAAAQIAAHVSAISSGLTSIRAWGSESAQVVHSPQT